MSDYSILECETLHDLVKHPDWKGFSREDNRSDLYRTALGEIEEYGSLSSNLALLCLNNLESEHLDILMSMIKGGSLCETEG